MTVGDTDSYPESGPIRDDLKSNRAPFSWLHEPAPEPEPEPEPDAGSGGSCPNPTRTDQLAVLAMLPDNPRTRDQTPIPRTQAHNRITRISHVAGQVTAQLNHVATDCLSS